MTDQAVIVALAYDAGTLINVTKTYAYVSNIRLRFNDKGDVIQVSERVPGGNQQWREARK